MTAADLSEVRDRDHLYIDGAWIEPNGTGRTDVESPSTEKIVASVVNGDDVDTDRAVQAAHRAFREWSETPHDERIAAVERLAAALDSRRNALGGLIATEVGMPLEQASTAQATMPVGVLEATARAAKSYEWAEPVGNSLVVRRPAGVVAAITPWNFPLHQIAAKVGPALVAGCTIVLKPSAVAPLNGFAFAECVAEAEIPPGVFNLVPGRGSVVGEAMVSHPLVSVVSLTGSVESGARVGQVAAAGIKRVCLELGGKSANVLLDDADLDAAIPSAVAQAFVNSGQACNALSRLLVPRRLLAEVEERLVAEVDRIVVGDPFEPGVTMGPVVNAAQRESVRGHIGSALGSGARLIAGGAEAPPGLATGYYLSPTVFSDVTPEMPIAQEEVFGPVLVVQPYDDEDDAVAIANSTLFGLSGGVWSADRARALSLAHRLRTGQVKINGVRTRDHFDAPFGGYGLSGLGRELGRFGIDEFTEVTSILG
ncbi:aldehyde dehydrogenase family protein [Saccharopolyspora indica]|uniref:aldehyde dehydrogenase family protein n=1 Tax=Saccharopolyspora indica TaxID=1229659 RepID=UPI0022EA31B1|nr:aldehyde dehydrogenase family protein [Saccharopolyspora indica]MDA3644178.1 aldehyde dehydrogenase family protein [Saccharopolyspora indica]